MSLSQPHTPARQRGLRLGLRGCRGDRPGRQGGSTQCRVGRVQLQVGSDGSASAGHDGRSASAAAAAVAQLSHDEPAAAAAAGSQFNKKNLA